VEALWLQLNTFMGTTVAADAVAMDSEGMQSSVTVPGLQQLAAFPSILVEAEIIPNSPSTVIQSLPAAQAEVNTVTDWQPEFPTPFVLVQSLPAAQAEVNTVTDWQPEFPTRTIPLENTVLDDTLLALGNVMSESYVDQCVIGNMGGIDLELNAIRHFPRNKYVQRNGLLVIGNMVINNRAGATKIGNAGGINLVLKGMREFQKDVQVQRSGLFAICNWHTTMTGTKTGLAMWMVALLW